MRNATLLLAMGNLVLVLGCVETDGGSDCEGAKCDNIGTGALDAVLEGRDDPIAAYLRLAADSTGGIEGDYRDVLDGVGEQLGCGPETEKTFSILLTRAGLFPRHIVTRCSDDPSKASQFFLSTQSDEQLGDIDPRNLKLYAWDATARTYRWYELRPETEGGPMQVAIDPPECLTCHTGPLDMEGARIPFTPIMNEINNPWTLWNAEPDFRSHQFEDTLDPGLAEQPIYREMTENGKLDSAANFERHIRAALDRVTTARLRARRNEAQLSESLDLLRPMFCEETLNYVSENHNTGETKADIIIDDAFRQLFLTLRPDDWPWDWLNDGVLRLAEPTADETLIDVMAVRGESNVLVEVGLVSRGVLSVEQALRLRALDWQRPALSDFRCRLFTDGEARLKLSPPDLSAYARNSDAIPVLFESLMQITTESGETIPLLPARDDVFYAIGDVEEAGAADAIASGDLSVYEVTLEELGETLESHFQSAQEPGFRTAIEEERLRRGCHAVLFFPAAPLVPGAEDCAL